MKKQYKKPQAAVLALQLKETILVGSRTLDVNFE